ncbi:MAG TPA: GGDEF domain-containing protein [Terriglobales bacterium]|nr:GGDEF domain-containing protein [Terriglobales bacterium]
MFNGGQPELQERLCTLNERLEELSALPGSAGHAEEFVALFQEKRRLETSLRAAPELRSRNKSAEKPPTKPARAGHDSDTVLANVNRELRRLEKRDGELWLIVTGTGILVAAGLLAVLLPAAFLRSGNLHFEITVSKELVCGLLVLLTLANTYIVSRRIEFRQLRQKTISTAMQNELIRLQSFTDPLTEIYNRRSLEELAGRFIGQAKRLRTPLTFLLIDLDRFKQVNTRFGHLTGDFVLGEVATLLKGSIRGADAAIRYGGDEFLIALANTGAAGAATVVNRIQTFLNDWNESSGLDDFTVSLSIGTAEWTDGKTLDEVLDLADQNMYKAKFQRVPSAEPGSGAVRSPLQPRD